MDTLTHYMYMDNTLYVRVEKLYLSFFWITYFRLHKSNLHTVGSWLHKSWKILWVIIENIYLIRVVMESVE